MCRRLQAEEANLGMENLATRGTDQFTPDEVALRPRKVHFQWDTAPLHWIQMLTDIRLQLLQALALMIF